MIFLDPYWGNITKMALLQRWLIVHSIIYYELCYSVVTDTMFDDNAQQLVKLQEKHPSEAKRTPYWYVFHDYDGSTGFHLYGRLEKSDKEYLYGVATNIRRLSINAKR